MSHRAGLPFGPDELGLTSIVVRPKLERQRGEGFLLEILEKVLASSYYFRSITIQ